MVTFFSATISGKDLDVQKYLHVDWKVRCMLREEGVV